MNYHKGFAATTVLIIVLVVMVLGGVVYAAMNPQVFQTLMGGAAQKNEGINADAKTSIAWRFTNAGEVEGTPYTNVKVLINGTAYETSKFVGSCSEIGANGGIDGKGLLAGELSGAQCWFAGGGNEIGVFASEDGGFEIMVGELGEGEEGAGMFRGNFSIKNTIRE